MQTFGFSVWGTPLYCAGVGNLNSPLLVVGGTHATEYMGMLSSVAFLEHLLCSDDPYTKAALEKSGVLVVPCLNPDGLALWQEGVFAAPDPQALFSMSGGDFTHWQANANGVDLNRNFDAGFDIGLQLAQKSGITAPGPTRFGGRAPFDQPETASLRRLCQTFLPRQMVCLHSQGEEIYYHYGTPPPQSALIAQILSLISGYKVCPPDPIASHAGCKDWFISRFDKPGFTIEQGMGQNPLPIEDFVPIWKQTLPMLLALLYL